MTSRGPRDSEVECKQCSCCLNKKAIPLGGTRTGYEDKFSGSESKCCGERRGQKRGEGLRKGERGNIDYVWLFV
eukprot:13644184-Heterocapsa_arctica.AAC.1